MGAGRAALTVVPGCCIIRNRSFNRSKELGRDVNGSGAIGGAIIALIPKLTLKTIRIAKGYSRRDRFGAIG